MLATPLAGFVGYICGAPLVVVAVLAALPCVVLSVFIYATMPTDSFLGCVIAVERNPRNRDFVVTFRCCRDHDGFRDEALEGTLSRSAKPRARRHSLFVWGPQPAHPNNGGTRLRGIALPPPADETEAPRMGEIWLYLEPRLWRRHVRLISAA
jgi:hypothetical protein